MLFTSYWSTVKCLFLCDRWTYSFDNTNVRENSTTQCKRIGSLLTLRTTILMCGRKKCKGAHRLFRLFPRMSTAGSLRKLPRSSEPLAARTTPACEAQDSRELAGDGSQLARGETLPSTGPRPTRRCLCCSSVLQSHQSYRRLRVEHRRGFRLRDEQGRKTWAAWALSYFAKCTIARFGSVLFYFIFLIIIFLSYTM